MTERKPTLEKWSVQARFSLRTWVVGICWFKGRNGDLSIYIYPFPMLYFGVHRDRT